MAYAEITSTKTVNLTSSSGTQTLTYYAGNKEKTTGSVVGNRDKKDITYYFDSTQSWITSVSITNKTDDTTNTAKNIKITYNENTGAERSVNLKLKDQVSSYYLIIKQAEGTPPTPVITEGTKYTFKWNFTHSAASSSSRDVPSVEITYLENTEIFGMINPNEGNQVTWDKAFMGQPGLSKEYTTEWPVIQVKPLTSGTYNIVPQNGIICEAFNIYNVELECSFGNFYLNLSNTTTYNITFNVSGRVVVPTSGTTIEIYINTVCSC